MGKVTLFVFAFMVASFFGVVSVIVDCAAADPVLRFTGDKSSVDLKWASNPDIPNLQKARTKNDGLLSYEMQIKINVNDDASDFYMEGLSFRVDDTLNTQFGISFFKSDLVPGSDQTICHNQER